MTPCPARETNMTFSLNLTMISRVRRSCLPLSGTSPLVPRWVPQLPAPAAIKKKGSKSSPFGCRLWVGMVYEVIMSGVSLQKLCFPCRSREIKPALSICL